MVKKIQVVRELGPRINLGPAIELDNVAQDIAQDSGFDVADVASVLHKAAERRDFYLRLGRPVHLGGLGNYTPTIDGKGRVKASLRLPASVLESLREDFRGEVINRENIGKSREELCEIYLQLYPDATIED